MREYTQEEIDKALVKIENMSHEQMCQLWRMTEGESIFFRTDLPTAKAFSDRLYVHFGGFTPEISKKNRWVE